MIAVRAVHWSEDLILPLRQQKPQLYIRGGNLHPVAGLVARRARPAIGAHALEKRSSLVHAPAAGAVRLRGSVRVRKKYSIRNERE